MADTFERWTYFDHRYTKPLPVKAGKIATIIEKALRIIREPLTHRKYVQHTRGILGESPPTIQEGIYLLIHSKQTWLF